MNDEEIDRPKLPFFVRHNVLTMILAVLAIIVLYGGYRVYDFFVHRDDYKLQSAEVSGLINFLKIHTLQAAVVQKMYQPDNASTWLINSDGQETFLYSKNLGTCEATFPTPCLTLLITDGQAVHTYLLPGDAEVYDGDLAQAWDISPYLTGYVSNSSTETEFENMPSINPGGGVFSISPDGKYLINYANQLQSSTTTIQLVAINPDGNKNPLMQFPSGYSFLAWGTDSNHVVLMKRSDTSSGVPFDLAIYDITNATTTHFTINLNSSAIFAGGEETAFKAFIYPSTMIYATYGTYLGQGDNYSGGVFSTDFNNPNVAATAILPNEIKMVGLIP